MLLGLEAEYEPGHEAELDRLLDAWPFQLVVLGVHVVDGFVFDDPSLRADPRWDDPDALLAAYYRDREARRRTTAASTSSPTSTTSGSGDTGRARRSLPRDRRRPGRTGRVRRRASS